MSQPLPSDHIHARIILGVAAASASLGIDPAEVLRRASLSPEALAGPDASVPVPAAAAVWRALEDLSGEPAVGLAVAERIPLGLLGFVYHGVHASETLRDACRRSARYSRLVSGPLRLSLHERGDEARVALDLPSAIGAHPFSIAQFILLVWLRASRSAVGGEIGLAEVRFVHPLRGDRARFEAAFGAPCRFEAPRAEVVFARRDLDRPVPSGDPALARWLDLEGDAQLDALARGDMVARARLAVRALLPRGEPRLEDVAADLHTAPRTLQRRLAEGGTSFAAVVDEARREIALRMVGEASVPLADVAFVTGFAEVSAFYRAFRRWTGATPASFRRAQSSPA